MLNKDSSTESISPGNKFIDKMLDEEAILFLIAQRLFPSIIIAK